MVSIPSERTVASLRQLSQALSAKTFGVTRQRAGMLLKVAGQPVRVPKRPRR